MKYPIYLSGIERRIPAGRRLPAAFTNFVDACRNLQQGDIGWFTVQHTPPKDLLGFDPGDKLLPVLRMGDGGFVAMWFRSRNSPTIIQCNSEGETSVIATNFADFLLRLSRQKTSLPDIDEWDPFECPRFKRLPRRVSPLAKLQREYQAWVETNQDRPEDTDDVSEAIRQELQRVLAKDMKAEIRESEKLLGYRLTDDDDFTSTVDMIAHLTSRSYKVTDLGGQPFPRPQRLRKVLDQLVSWLGRPLKSCEISVWSDGCVYVDRNVRLGDSSLYDA